MEQALRYCFIAADLWYSRHYWWAVKIEWIALEYALLLSIGLRLPKLLDDMPEFEITACN